MNQILVSSIEVVPINPQNGLCGFASCVINNQFFLGGLGIHSSPSSPSGFRITFPTKVLASGKTIELFHPITQDAGKAVSEAIINKYLELMDRFNHIDVSKYQSLFAPLNSITKAYSDASKELNSIMKAPSDALKALKNSKLIEDAESISKTFKRMVG